MKPSLRAAYPDPTDRTLIPAELEAAVTGSALGGRDPEAMHPECTAGIQAIVTNRECHDRLWRRRGHRRPVIAAIDGAMHARALGKSAGCNRKLLSLAAVL